MPQTSQSVDAVLVDRAAAGAVDHLLVRVSGDDLRAAVGAVHAQVLEALELAALALPVADRVLDELERAGSAEVREREDAREDRLQAGLLALLRQQVHLQETLVGLALDVDQVRQRHEGADLREVVADRLLFRHRTVHQVAPFGTSCVPHATCRRDHTQATRVAESRGLEPCDGGRSPLHRFRSTRKLVIPRPKPMRTLARNENRLT